MDHQIIRSSYKFLGFLGSDISLIVDQLPLEKMFGIPRLFLLYEYRSIYCSTERPLKPIYYRRDYSCCRVAHTHSS